MKAKRLMHFCMVALMASMMISCNGCKDDAYGPEAVTGSRTIPTLANYIFALRV